MDEGSGQVQMRKRVGESVGGSRRCAVLSYDDRGLVQDGGWRYCPIAARTFVTE